MRRKWARNCAVKVTRHIQGKRKKKKHFSTLKLQKIWVKLPNWECWQKWLRFLQVCVWNTHLRVFPHINSSHIYLPLSTYEYTIISPWASSASENNESIGHKPFRFDLLKDALETAFDTINWGFICILWKPRHEC